MLTLCLRTQATLANCGPEAALHTLWPHTGNPALTGTLRVRTPATLADYPVCAAQPPYGLRNR